MQQDPNPTGIPPALSVAAPDAAESHGVETNFNRLPSVASHSVLYTAQATANGMDEVQNIPVEEKGGTAKTEETQAVQAPLKGEEEEEADYSNAASGKQRSGRTSKTGTPVSGTASEIVRPRSTRSNNAVIEDSPFGEATGPAFKRTHRQGASRLANDLTASNTPSRSPSHTSPLSPRPGNPDSPLPSPPYNRPVRSQAVPSHILDNTITEDEEDEPISDSEPRYCYCNGVSYGEMVACDNADCKREWFHLPCVGLNKAPTGRMKWYCDECRDNMGVGSNRAKGRPGTREGR